METHESENDFAGQVHDENTNEELQPEITIVNSDIRDDEYELPSVEEDEHEDLAGLKIYSTMSKKELLDKLRVLVDSGQIEAIRRDVDAIKDAFYEIYQQEQEALEKARLSEDYEESEYTPDPVEQEFKAVISKYKTAKAELLRDNENAKEENYKLKLALVEELKELVKEEENLNLTYQKFYDILNRWRETGPVPQIYAKDLWDTWHHCVEVFYDYVKINRELRDLDLRKNLAAKEELIAKAESLLDTVSANEVFIQLQNLQNLWREIGPVPHEHKEPIWEKFKDVIAKINQKYYVHQEQRREEQQNNLRIKYELCEHIEMLNKESYNTPKEWHDAYNRLAELIVEWRNVGFIPKRESEAVFVRFQNARNEFAEKKRDFFQRIKQERVVNVKEKQNLCKQAEDLMNSDNWQETAEAIRNLQKRWRESSGSMSRRQSEVLWRRFRLACDTFFARRSKHFNELDQENIKIREQLIAEIENFVPGKNAEEAFDALNDFKQRWQEMAYLPPRIQEELNKRCRNILDKQFQNLKLSSSERKVLRFKDKLETMSHAKSSGRSDRKFREERDKLYNKMMQLKNDVALWENNVGFFAKSKNADEMIADIKRKIQKTKEDILVLEEQIKLIDKQNES
ncbi:MAG: DUF349 domain-containing protein [Prevotellaceae bacterium]|jgi:hypothetical protein|nr:DUF349 domain-containing protein [Prevotellaceae bacterium]